VRTIVNLMFPRAVRSGIFFLTSIVLITTIQSQTASVPVEHWVYDFLERLETRGLINSEDFNMRPFSRMAVAELLLQASKSENQSKLSRKIPLTAVSW